MNDSFAIVGMSCQSSGIENLDDYWQVISQGKTTLKRYNSDELTRSGINASDFNSSDYVPVGGDIEGADNFDAKFFGVPPKEALYMDPQHRKFLEETYHAFENAGLNPETYRGLAGVFAGCSQNNYRLQNIEKSHAGQDWSEFQKQIASDKDFLATQVAYKLGLRGPALTIQTACSTSLVAVDTACKYLESMQCDLAVAGGSYINVPLQQGYKAMEGGILSAQGECRAFDDDADGTIFSSAVGVVLIKRLDDAIADGDNIYGVIEGIATNNDGNKKVSYTAPGYEGQAEVVTIAQAMAGIDPAEITYVEAHGTGTKLGDPLEVQALTNAFRLSTNNRQYCVLGSVKSNIGHCDVAAGIMGLIKTCLCLTHKILPPQINFDKINSEINIEESPFVINLAEQHWPAGPSNKRIAAVSSFGVGGTNAHALLSEPPVRDASKPHQSQLPVILPITGKDADSAIENARRLGNALKENTLDINDVARTLSLGRAEFEYRDYVVTSSAANANEQLLAISNRSVIQNTSSQSKHKPNCLIFMFPGQGSQHINMARELYENETIFRDSMDECFSILNGILEYDLKQVIYPGVEETDFASDFLKHTEVAQPALFSVSYAMAQLLISQDLRPEKMIGHSIGEYVAACLSGVFSLKDALKIVAKRGQLMQAMDSGSMLAVIADYKSVEAELSDELSIAAINSPNITVVSGETSAVQSFEEKLNELSIRAVPLHTSHAFHSYMMEPMLAPFIHEFGDVKLSSPQIPFVSCVTGEEITPEQACSPEYWAQQVRNPVLFSKGILALVENSKAVCLEAGPSNALTSALSAHDFTSEVLFYNTLPAAAKPDKPLSQYYSALGNLWKSTSFINSQQLHRNGTGRRIPLPGYSFSKTRYWIDKADEQLIDTPAVSAQNQTVNNEHKLSNQDIGGLLKERLKTLLTEISGVEFTEDNYQSDFISLGFESLLVAEIRSNLKSELGLEIDIPQLLSSFNSFEKLLARCVSELGDTINWNQLNSTQTTFNTKTQKTVGDSNQRSVPYPGNSASINEHKLSNQDIEGLLKERLKTLLTEISGVDFTEDNYQSDFISLGFESLLVAEIRGSLKSELGLEIGIPQLLSSSNSFEKLLACCVSELGDTINWNQLNSTQTTFNTKTQKTVGDSNQRSVPYPGNNASINDVYNAVLEQSNLLRRLIELQSNSDANSGSDEILTTAPETFETIIGFEPRPTPEAHLGKDPEGNPHWYLPDQENSGQYRLADQEKE